MNRSIGELIVFPSGKYKVKKLLLVYLGIPAIIGLGFTIFFLVKLARISDEVLALENSYHSLIPELLKYAILFLILFSFLIYMFKELKKAKYRNTKLAPFLDQKNKEITRVYRIETTVRTLGIKAGKLDSFALELENGEHHQVDLLNKEEFENVLVYIEAKLGRKMSNV